MNRLSQHPRYFLTASFAIITWTLSTFIQAATIETGGTAAAAQPSTLNNNNNIQSAFPGSDWAYKAPSEVGLDQSRLNQFRDHLTGRGSVVRFGYMSYSWGDQTLNADIASAAKPFYSTLLFKAVDDGRLPSLDTRVNSYEPCLTNLNSGLGYKDRNITFRHMASQISNYGVREAPGQAFNYNDWQTALLADTLVLRLYGASWTNVDQQVLYPHLGNTLQFQDGPTMIAFGTGYKPGRISISVRDMARFGLLYMNNGNWNGTQVISSQHASQAVSSPLPLSVPMSAGAAAEMCSSQRTFGSEEVPDNQYDHKGSYSWYWWVNGVGRDGQRVWPDAPLDTYMACGHGNCMRALVVIPSLGIVASWNDTRLDQSGTWESATNEALGLLINSVTSSFTPTPVQTPAAATSTLTPVPTTSPTRTPTNPAPVGTSTRTPTRTITPSPTRTPTRTVTPPPASTPSLTPTRTPTSQQGGPVVTSFSGVAQGQSLSGQAFIQALVSSNGSPISQVSFVLNGPYSTTWTERVSPYYFMGDNSGSPYGWNTNQHPDGAYSLTATATDQLGRSSSLQVAFYVGNQTTPTATSTTISTATAPAATPTSTRTSTAPTFTPTRTPTGASTQTSSRTSTRTSTRTATPTATVTPIASPTVTGGGRVNGALIAWHTLWIDFTGPNSSETANSPSPFLDYKLQVRFTGPGGQIYDVPGFFDGNGSGQGSGSVWRVRFTPDQAGVWSYQASFRSGTQVAVSLDPNAGSPAYFDGTTGTFTIAPRDPNAPGFLKWGRLGYQNSHYLKFQDGPYWIKGGTDEPENLLAYSGFDDTNGSHNFSNHVQDWLPGDPDWNGGAGQGIIGALNYLASKQVNSVYFLPMNIGGDGQDAWPFVGPIDGAGNPSNDNLHYDISKLAQWEMVFAHAQKKGILLHVVLNEAEAANKRELDDATLGIERKLFYRELAARFGHHLALQWNISEEYDFQLPLNPDVIKTFAGYVQQVDPYDHPITVHNNGLPETAWTPFLGDSRFSVISFQDFEDVAGWGALVEEWRNRSQQSGRPLPIGIDEIRRTSATNMPLQRKEIFWPTFLSGGNLELILEGNLAVNDFRTFEQAWIWMGYARSFLQQHPFWEMTPQDSRLTGESSTYGGGQVFAKSGEVYLLYLPDASSTGTLNLTGITGMFEQRWYNPRTGTFEGSIRTVSAGGNVSLGTPPHSPSEDWALSLARTSSGTGTPTATSIASPTRTPTRTVTPPPASTPSLTPTRTPTSQQGGPVVTSFSGVAQGQSLSGQAFIQALVSSNGSPISQVSFVLNGPYSTTWTERVSPYYFMGDNSGSPYGWNTNQHPDGAYSLTATATDQLGRSSSLQVTFTVSNP